MPSIKTVDMVWHWQTGVLQFHSTNEKVNTDFLELFEQTFGLRPMLDCAYTAALYGNLDLTEAEKKALESIEPCQFVDDDTALNAMREE